MNKRAQEEIVGFAVIMIIIAIVFLVFLGIGIRKGGSETNLESTDVRHFLDSMMEYTTSCSVTSGQDFLKMGELFEECLENKICINGDNSCEVLRTETESIFEGSWNVDLQSSVKGLEFEAFYFSGSNSSQGESILSIMEGSCNASSRGASFIRPAFPGTIEGALRICS